MAKQITEAEFQAIATELGIEKALVKTVCEVEGAGEGFSLTTGKILIQFEPHIFKRYTKQVIKNGVEGQATEWLAFNQAFKLNPEAAMLSTSIGIGQVMGFNFATAGFSDVAEMWDNFKESEANQLRGMLKHIKSSRTMFRALLAKDWKTFARLYNGVNYAAGQYDIKLAKAYAKHSA